MLPESHLRVPDVAGGCPVAAWVLVVAEAAPGSDVLVVARRLCRGACPRELVRPCRARRLPMRAMMFGALLRRQSMLTRALVLRRIRVVRPGTPFRLCSIQRQS